MENDNNDFEQKRGVVRIADSFPITYKTVSLEDFEEISSFYINNRTASRPVTLRYVNHVHAMDWASLRDEEEYNPSLIKVLSYLDKKMDMILCRQEEMLKNFDVQPREEGQYSVGESIDISGSGLKILTVEELKKDTIIELTIEPFIYPPLFIMVLGKVIQVDAVNDKEKNGFEVSTEFAAINEHDRDEIIKYIFKKQRESIASHKLADN